MADRYEEYRERAAYCERMSLAARTPEMREDWLRLAQRWLAMIPHEESHEKDARTNPAERRT